MDQNEGEAEGNFFFLNSRIQGSSLVIMLHRVAEGNSGVVHLLHKTNKTKTDVYSCDVFFFNQVECKQQKQQKRESRVKI